MAENVAQALQDNATTIFERLSQNVDVANVVMGFIGRITILCAQLGKPVQGVDMGSFQESGGDFKATLTFNTLLISPPSIWTANRYDDLKGYVGARNISMARVLESNVRLLAGLRGLVQTIEKFCDRKRIRFQDFKVKKAFITPDNRVCVVKSGVETLDRWGR